MTVAAAGAQQRSTRRRLCLSNRHASSAFGAGSAARVRCFDHGCCWSAAARHSQMLVPLESMRRLSLRHRQRSSRTLPRSWLLLERSHKALADARASRIGALSQPSASAAYLTRASSIVAAAGAQQQRTCRSSCNRGRLRRLQLPPPCNACLTLRKRAARHRLPPHRQPQRSRSACSSLCTRHAGISESLNGSS